MQNPDQVINIIAQKTLLAGLTQYANKVFANDILLPKIHESIQKISDGLEEQTPAQLQAQYNALLYWFDATFTSIDWSATGATPKATELKETWLPQIAKVIDLLRASPVDYRMPLNAILAITAAQKQTNDFNPIFNDIARTLDGLSALAQEINLAAVYQLKQQELAYLKARLALPQPSQTIAASSQLPSTTVNTLLSLAATRILLRGLLAYAQKNFSTNRNTVLVADLQYLIEKTTARSLEQHEQKNIHDAFESAMTKRELTYGGREMSRRWNEVSAIIDLLYPLTEVDAVHTALNALLTSENYQLSRRGQLLHTLGARGRENTNFWSIFNLASASLHKLTNLSLYLKPPAFYCQPFDEIRNLQGSTSASHQANASTSVAQIAAVISPTTANVASHNTGPTAAP